MKFRFYLLCLLVLSCVIPAKASHVVGGDLTYTYKGSNRYEVKLVLFVDCINGNPGAIADDVVANIGIFDVNNFLLDTITIVRNGPVRIDSVSYNCIVPPSNACVDMYEYVKEITLLPSQEGYLLVFQRCCRNNSISNLEGPDTTGSTYMVKIPGTGIVEENSSAVFRKLPPNFLCANELFVFDHSAIDPDGDSLVYELYHPYAGASDFDPLPRPPYTPPYHRVTWSNSYTEKFPIGTDAKLTLHSKTGELRVTPKVLGQFVIGIMVKEYRKGVLVGETRRDYQFNVLPCDFQVRARFNAPALFCEREVTFDNQSTGTEYLWDFGDDAKAGDTSSAASPTYTYAQDGVYKVRLIAKTGNCADTAFKTIAVYDPSNYRYTVNDTQICLGDTISLGTKDPVDGFVYQWTPSTALSDAGSASPLAWPEEDITYVVVKSQGECVYIDTVRVSVANPGADFSYEMERTCDATRIVFINRSVDAESYEWYVEGELVSSEVSPVFTLQYGKSISGWMTAINGNCQDTKPFTITAPSVSAADIFIPNVITPNGDGKNECFYIHHPGLPPHCQLATYRIYNRWGQMVFSSEMADCWHGTDRNTGDPLPPGVYYLVVDLEGGGLYEGTVTVVR